METYTQEHLEQATSLVKEWQERISDGSAPIVESASRTVELRRHPIAEALSQGFTDVVGVPRIGGEVIALEMPQPID